MEAIESTDPIWAIFEHAPSMLAYWDKDLQCRFANRAYERWFGAAPAKLLDSSLRDLLGPELFARNEPYIREALKGHRQHFERDIRGPDGVVRHSLATYVPHIVQGKVLGFIAEVNDVSAIYRHRIRPLEASLVASASMDTFGPPAAVVAQDGGATSSSASALASNPCNMPARASRHDGPRSAIERAAHRIGHWMRPNARRDERMALIDLSTALPALRDALARAAGPFIRLILPAGIGCRVECPPRDLELALLNLVINAREAMPHGGEVVVEALHLDLPASLGPPPASGWIALRVSDTGIGMAPDVLGRAREPFFTTKPRGQSSGLGLAMVDAFARRSSGMLLIASAPGLGTAATIALPAAPADAAVFRTTA